MSPLCSYLKTCSYLFICVPVDFCGVLYNLYIDDILMIVVSTAQLSDVVIKLRIPYAILQHMLWITTQQLFVTIIFFSPFVSFDVLCCAWLNFTNKEEHLWHVSQEAETALVQINASTGTVKQNNVNM